MNYLLRVIAGAVFGLYMAHLLYFLNPQIEISALRLTGVTTIYAVIAGAIFGTLLWLLHLFRVRFSEAHRAELRARGFGFVVAAAFLSALVYWGHVLLLSVYLPRGAVRNLSKASTIVALSAVVLFVLWLAERTASRKTAATLLLTGCTLVLLSSFFLYQRRERYRGEDRPGSITVVETRQPRRVIVVAIRNLPFDWVLQLIGEDLVPFFGRAREESFLTRIEPFPTTSPKSLWASLATGKLPHAHGVTGRFSYQTPLNPDAERFLLVPYWVGFKAWGLIPPVKRISAQLPAGDSLPLWTLFERLGHPSAVVNWPSSAASRHPATVSVSDRTVEQVAKSSSDAYAAAVFRQSLRSGPTLAVLSLNGLEEIQQAEGVEGNRLPSKSTSAGEAIRAYVERLDQILSAIDQDFPQAILIVVSPSGPHPPPLPATPLVLATTLLTEEEPGSSDGFLLIRGPNTSSRVNPAPAAVTDLVPTVLFAAGLPVARDMDGRPIAEAFNESFMRNNPISLIPTYEAKPIEQREAQ